MCEIVPFPISRSRRQVLSVAIAIERVGQPAWVEFREEYRRDMRAARVPSDLVERELKAFADAVLGEVWWRGRRPEGGDAA